MTDQNKVPSSESQDQALALMLRSAIEQAGDGIAVADMDGNILFANHAWAEMHGYQFDEISAKHLSIFHTEEQLETEVIPFNEVVAQKGGNAGEVGHVRKDGTTFLTWMTTTVRTDDAGNPLGLIGTARDITQQKETETVLRHFEAIVKSSGEAIFSTTPKGEVISWNPAAERMFGYMAEEIIGQPVRILAPEDLQDQARQLLMNLAQGQNVSPVETVRQTKDGRRIDVLLSASAMKDSLGNVVGFSAVLSDITESRQVEENVFLLTSAIEQTGDGIAIADMDGNVLFANQAWASMHGYARETLLGKHLSIFHNAEQLEKEVAPFNEIAFKEGSNAGEIGHTRQDGTTFPTWMTVTVLRDDADTPVGLIGTARDITEQKQVELAAQESQKLLRNFLDNFPDGAWVKDLEGHFVLVNRYVCEQIYNAPEDDILGKTIYDTFPKEIADALWESEKRLIERGEILSVEEKVPQADGVVYDKLTTKFPLYDTEGQISGLGGVLIDITERKQLEAQVQETLERRGYQVQVSNQISQEISQASALNELFERVVTLTKEQLGYYHTQLLRYDPAQDAVTLITGYGDIGQQMLGAGHQMPLGVGLIGTAAATGEIVMRPDLSADPDWRPNPILPETRGEIAIPIKLGDQILGVLDVQSDRIDAITEDDRLLLEGLCGQIAIAIDQTRLRQEMDERLQELSALYRTMSREGWEQYRQTGALPGGFLYDHDSITPISAENLHQEAFATIPMVLPGGEAIGEIAIAETPDQPIAMEDRTFLEQVSEQVALALESARLFEQTQSVLSAIQESEAQLSEALKIAHLGNWEYDVEADLFTFNDPFYAIFHTTAAELGGYQISSAQYASQFVHPDDAEMVGVEIGKALNTPGPSYSNQLEHRFLYADGGVGNMAVQVYVERDENDKITRFYGANQDITERKSAEEAVREARERFELAVSGSNDGIWDWNIITNSVYYSTRLKEMVGYSDDEFGNDFAEFEEKLHPDDHDAVMAMVEEYLSGKIPSYEPEFRFRHKDGSYRWILSRGTAIRNDEGVPVRMAGSHTDITERRSQEQANQKRAEELATVAEVGTIISTILDEQTLLEQVVTLTQRRFDLYHCHIFLLTPEGQHLQIRACGWEEGDLNAGTHHDASLSLDLQQSLVAQSARAHQAVIVNDVRNDPNWLPNELLPETRAEMAIPLLAGDQLLGVLDVQANQVGRFTPEDVSIMTTLASQVSVALQNARTYARTQRQAENEALINLISQRIQSTTSVENALQVAIREIGRALGAKKTSIQLDVTKK